ncbi:putative nucleotidyltransferase with HDIG domain [Methylobacter tundripaludum]|uniref:Putative nucleotidyltransferase with HDIG domain n=1 Tax=Methylobacter tundripaludum TaxID=173365 RepID=A0A2S6HHP7_9GAMM|nr:HD-GYP domain-containing protein [Methylobacter tundripaludum]PPK77005.1 putative nucleotidyltransferase with HDIG domain [Methylobacter tundripaludum]
MIKKISIQQLKPGMFIHDINCVWMEHPFLVGALKIKNDKTIEKIAGLGVREVYIDTLKGLDVIDAPTETEVNAEIEHKMLAMVQQVKPITTTSTLSEELKRSREVYGEANKIISNIMHDVRIGKQIEVERIDPVVEKMANSILRNKDALLSLCRIKNKDDYTFLHSVSVGALLISFAHALDFKRDVIKQLGVGGMLHDIGKTKVPNEILNKPGALTEEEFVIMKSHVVHGCSILRKSPGIAQVSFDVASQHHERFDGSGYPLGLKNSEMSVYGQMAAIVDVYDAITADRCYHKGMEPTVAIRKMFEWSKFHFNPKLLRTFIRIVGIYPVGTLVMLESGKIGVVIEQSETDMTRPLVRIIFDAKKNYFIAPKDIDLAKPLGQGGGDRIVNYESSAKWDIDPNKFM